MNTRNPEITTHGCIAGTASLLPLRRVLSSPANDNVEGGRHDLACPNRSSQQRQWFPQTATGVLADLAISVALLVLVWALFAFALAMDG